MIEQQSARDASDAASAPTIVRRDWSAVAAVLAALIGFLALLVSGYTAHVQRQQVRARVWPYLILANYDNKRALGVVNKGVGPALIRGVRVLVDGKPQPDWKHVLDALGVERPPHSYSLSTISVNVLSAGEGTAILSFDDAAIYKAFRAAASARMAMQICYCSTLGECWQYSDDIYGNAPAVAPLAQCPEVPRAEAFHD
jgi:hypothetical protein